MKKNKKTEQNSEKMTIYEYEQKYVKRENVRSAKLIVRIIAAVTGVFLIFCLFSITMKVYELNQYAGYGAAAVSVLLFIILFIVPLVRIFKTDYFVVNVNAYSARKAQLHNRNLRKKLADRAIDLTSKVDGITWYDSAVVGELAIAVNTNNEKAIKSALTKLYTGSVKKAAHELIFKSATKAGLYSALSQTNKADAVLVAFLNLQLVKDLVFMYGFRPSDAKLVKIFGRVLQNSLIAYGLGGIKIGNSIAQTMGNAVKGIPLLGSAIATIVDSSVQGLTNGVLATVIGFQTVKYLSREYRLQEILDGIEITETDEEFKETCSQLERELKNNGKLPKAV